MTKSHRLLRICAIFVVLWMCANVASGSVYTQLKQVRAKSQDDKTEFVLDLSSPALSYTVNSNNPKQIAIQFPGSVDKALTLHSLELPTQKNAKSVYWEAKSGKVQLFIKRDKKTPISVYPLSNPDRLVVSIPEVIVEPEKVAKAIPAVSTPAAKPTGDVQATSSTEISPGVKHRRIIKVTDRGRLNINIVDVDLNNPEVSIEPALASNHMHGKARVLTLASQHNAVAAINASYFKPDQGTVLGTVIMNRELISGPIFNRVCLGISADKKISMARIQLKGKLVSDSGNTVQIQNVNQPRIKKDEVILYSSRWGRMAPNTPRDGVSVQIVQNRISEISTDRMSIPDEGYVLTGPTEILGELLHTGDGAIIQLATVPDWANMTHALSGGPYLVRGGQIYVDLQEQAFRQGGFTAPAPRTAVGVTASNHLLMVTVDGRKKAVSVGMTLSEMAHLMRGLGAVEAMNFDGGSSTQMVVKGHVVNSPTTSGGAQVASALMVRAIEPPIQEVIGATDGTTNTGF